MCRIVGWVVENRTGLEQSVLGRSSKTERLPRTACSTAVRLI